MKTLLSGALATLLIALSLAAEEAELWSEGRITPEQPFRAQVVGIVSSWGGAVVILREEGELGRYCIADLIVNYFSYRIVTAEEFDKASWLKRGATFLEPSVAVERFSWSMGVHRIGAVFGKDDFVAQWAPKSQSKADEG